MIKKIFISFFKITLLVFFAGCSDDSSNNPHLVDSDPQTPSAEYMELYSNYTLLDIFYYNAHLKKELNPDVNVYYNISFEAENSKGACTKKFANICAMYNQMSDPYTRYYDPQYTIQVLNMIYTSDVEVGIGVKVKKVSEGDSSYLVVSEIYPNSPADSSGLKIGDTIINVDGSSPATVDGFEKLVAGQQGDRITITVNRDSIQENFSMTINEIQTPSVHLNYIDSIPVITIDEFVVQSIGDAGTYEEFHTIIENIVAGGAKSAVIDLRTNPGGADTECLNVSAEFLGKGDTIIIDVEATVDSIRQGDTRKYIQKFDTVTYTTKSNGLAKDLYTVFLASDTSASCAELMLSAVTVNKKTPVVGKTTFGKGIGQSVKTTYSKGLSFITSVYSHDKDGNSFHKYGIAPDYEIDDADEQLIKALELAKKGTEKRSAGYGKTPTGNFAKANTDFAPRNIFKITGRYKFADKLN